MVLAPIIIDKNESNEKNKGKKSRKEEGPE